MRATICNTRLRSKAVSKYGATVEAMVRKGRHNIDIVTGDENGFNRVAHQFATVALEPKSVRAVRDFFIGLAREIRSSKR